MIRRKRYRNQNMYKYIFYITLICYELSLPSQACTDLMVTIYLHNIILHNSGIKTPFFHNNKVMGKQVVISDTHACKVYGCMLL